MYIILFIAICNVAQRARFNLISNAVMHGILSKGIGRGYQMKCGKYRGPTATKVELGNR